MSINNLLKNIIFKLWEKLTYLACKAGMGRDWSKNHIDKTWNKIIYEHDSSPYRKNKYCKPSKQIF